MIRKRLVICVLSLFSTMPIAVCAENEALLDSKTSSPAQEKIAAWIRQLDANQFAEREEASRKLKSVGESGIPALAEAATGTSREVRQRALDILHRHFTRGANVEKKAAENALKKLAASDHASSARRAKDILSPPAPPRVAAPIVLGGVQIQVVTKQGKNKQNVRITPQGRQIEAEDNGRKIKIDAWNDGSIEIEVTEEKDGKQIKKRYAAKNELDLKKKHPDAHKLFEKHNLAVPAIQIQIAPNAPPRPPKP